MILKSTIATIAASLSLVAISQPAQAQGDDIELQIAAFEICYASTNNLGFPTLEDCIEDVVRELKRDANNRDRFRGGGYCQPDSQGSNYCRR